MAVNPGRLVLVKVDTNNVGGAGANWVTIAQQREGTLGQTTESIDASHKDDNGYASFVQGARGWSISAGGLLDAADSTLAFLQARWETTGKAYFQIDSTGIGGSKREGRGLITDYSQEFAFGDAVKYTLEVTGDGQLTASP